MLTFLILCKCRIFRLILLWPGTAPAASFWVFPICFSVFENPALRQSVTINTCVNRFLFGSKMAWGWLNNTLLEEKVTKALPQETSIDRKEHNQISQLQNVILVPQIHQIL